MGSTIKDFAEDHNKKILQVIEDTDNPDTILLAQALTINTGLQSIQTIKQSRTRLEIELLLMQPKTLPWE